MKYAPVYDSTGRLMTSVASFPDAVSRYHVTSSANALGLPQPKIGDVVERRQGPSGIVKKMTMIRAHFELTVHFTGLRWMWHVYSVQSGNLIAIREIAGPLGGSDSALWHLREIASNMLRPSRSYKNY